MGIEGETSGVPSAGRLPGRRAEKLREVGNEASAQRPYLLIMQNHRFHQSGALGAFLACLATACAGQRQMPAPARASAGGAASIVIDGVLDDWRAVPVWTRFSSVPAIGSAPVTVYATDDAHFWYLSVTMRDSTVVSAMPGTMHVLIDADADSTTGGTAYEMRGVDFALDLSRLDRLQAGGHGAGVALRTVSRAGLGDFRSAYDLQVVTLPTWSTDRFELRIARDGTANGWPRLGARLRAQVVRVAPDSARVATPVQSYAFTTPLDTMPLRGAPAIPDKAPDAVRVAHWNVSEGSFRTPGNHARLLAAVAPDIILLDEVAGDVDSTALAAFFARPELARLGSWRFVHGQSGGRQRGVIAARGRAIRPDSSMRYMRYPEGSLDSLARSDARIQQRVIDVEREANIASTGAWVALDGVETLFVTVDLTSGGYLGSPNDAFRLLQARTMRRYILDAIGASTPKAPVVIAGDYNSVASYESVRVLQEALDTDGTPLAMNRALRLDARTASTWRNDSVAQFTPGRLDLALYSDGVFEQTGGFVFATEDLTDRLLGSLQITRDMSRKSSDHLIVVTDLRRRQGAPPQ
jgi:hypothetical protein